MRIYVNKNDINGTELGSTNCPIARALHRRFPDMKWTVDYSNYPGALARGWRDRELAAAVIFTISGAGRKLMREFDRAALWKAFPSGRHTINTIKPRHVGLRKKELLKRHLRKG